MFGLLLLIVAGQHKTFRDKRDLCILQILSLASKGRRIFSADVTREVTSANIGSNSQNLPLALPILSQPGRTLVPPTQPMHTSQAPQFPVVLLFGMYYVVFLISCLGVKEGFLVATPFRSCNIAAAAAAASAALFIKTPFRSLHIKQLDRQRK